MKKLFSFFEVNVWELVRFVLGFIFLWAFLDKLFGLRFATPPESSWISGASPTTSFLKFATDGTFATIFQSIAGSAIVDWLYMIGLFGVGIALLLGIGVQIASYSGALMMFLFWLAVFPPEHNPFVDEHIVYILFLLGMKKRAGLKWSLKKKWKQTDLVTKYKFLE